MARISIFTPTHDTRFLRECYSSIKDQPFDEWVVLLNHGAKAIDFGDARVRMVQAPAGLPPFVGALKAHACSLCTGDIFVELDHDDLLFPDAIAEIKRAFEDEAVGFVYGNACNVNADWSKPKPYGAEFGWRHRGARFERRTEDGGLRSEDGGLKTEDGRVRAEELDEHVSFEPSPEAVSRIWYAPNHPRAFRRSVYEAVGGYRAEMRILDDLDLMCRMYLATTFKHIDRPLYVYRIHGENTWLRNNREIQANTMRIYDEYIERMAIRGAGTKGLRCLDLGGRFGGGLPKNGDSPSERGGRAVQSPFSGRYASVDLKDADVCCDLNGTWPFADSSVGVVRAFDVFEHLREPLHTMRELYRVLAPGGWAFVQVPSTDGRGAFQDPTHVSFWNENSFRYYTEARFARYIDTPVRFQAVRLFTGAKNADGVCWTSAHLVSLKDGYRPCGKVMV